MLNWITAACLLAANSSLAAGTATFARTLPKPLASHPGNTFLAGEEVVIDVAGETESWRLLDYEGKTLAEVSAKAGKAVLGQLPAGFYRLSDRSGSNWISLGVISRLLAPTPLDSPVGVDVAMSWFYPTGKMDAVASLCALAGVNWVRDRLSWGEMEAKREQFAMPNRYDAAALAQSRAGLRVLQVMHASPSWANPNGKRFPPDLRDAHRFYAEMARRWKGQVQAFEPWNEADIPMFGGHTGSEMAALQKAAWLGLKAGNPDLIACLNVFAIHQKAQLEDLNQNAAWPYFDTFNLHHYEPFEAYPRLYADFRAVSAGKPLWVTECSLPVKWTGDEKLKEPTEADLKVQSERVAKTFATSLHEGTAAIYYFLLPHYVEGKTQFGILRPDLTPRPAFIALAAVGRLLAEARPIGRIKSTDEEVRAFVFRAKPDGRTKEILVAWTTGGESSLDLAAAAEKVFDHLGRPRESERTLKLTTAPVFVVLPKGGAKQFTLAPPAQPAPLLKGKPSPVVLQVLWPEEKIVLANSAYRVSPEKTESIPLFAYNFGPRALGGKLEVTAPDGWTALLRGEALELAPMERKELALEVSCHRLGGQATGTVRVQGEFGGGGRPVLSFRMMPAEQPP